MRYYTILHKSSQHNCGHTLAFSFKEARYGPGKISLIPKQRTITGQKNKIGLQIEPKYLAKM